MQNRALESLVLGLWFLTAVVVHVRNDFLYRGRELISGNLCAVDEEIEVKKVTVLDSNLFDLTIDHLSLKTIKCRLDSKVIEGSRSDLKRLFRKINNPKIALVYRQENGVWIVKMSFFMGGKKMFLEDWLASNNLLVEK